MVPLRGDTSTILITDTFNTDPNTNLSGVEVLGQNIIIAINNFNTGPSLWKMDIVTHESELLQSFGLNYGYSNFWLTKVEGHIFAQLNNETGSPGDGVAEIWKTDGTAGGTVLVKNLPETNPFTDFQFTAFSNKLVFLARDSLHGEEIWISDGSIINTYLLEDIFPGTGDGQISDLTIADGLIYFAANDSLHGKELWVSDGTSSGTNLLVDIVPGNLGSNPYSISAINGSLYFSADNGIDGSEPYKSDGTPEGTQQLANINPTGSSSPSAFTYFESAIFFSANQSTFDYELFKEDLNTGMVTLVKNINPTGASIPSNLHEHNGFLFFTASDGQLGNELWQTDGTTIGTQMVKDLNNGAGSSYISNFAGLGPRLFFGANDGNGYEMWVLDAPIYEVCFGESITIETNNSAQLINWYDAPQAGQLLGSGISYTVNNVNQNKIIYADITGQGCTSPRYSVPVSIAEDCPCTGPEYLLLNQTYTQIDHFTIHAIQEISSPSIFLDGSDMIYKAPNSVLLQPGLEVHYGSQFQVAIEPCPGQ